MPRVGARHGRQKRGHERIEKVALSPAPLLVALGLVSPERAQVAPIHGVTERLVDRGQRDHLLPVRRRRDGSALDEAPRICVTAVVRRASWASICSCVTIASSRNCASSRTRLPSSLANSPSARSTLL